MLKSPIITEKTMNLSKGGFYTFEVGRSLNKIELAKLIEEKFKIDVVSIRTINIKGKIKPQKTKRGYFKTAPLRKVIIKVKPGQKIAYFETPAEEDTEAVVTKAEEKKETKEKKSLLKGTKVKIEKVASEKKTKEKKGAK